MVPFVEIGAGLAGNGEGVFKTCGGDKGDTGSLALEQCIGGDGGSVADVNGSSGDEAGDFANSFEDGVGKSLIQSSGS